jgi:vancomycin resistance protein YoaR
MNIKKIINILTIITSIILIVSLIVLTMQIFYSSETKNRFTENVVISGINVNGLKKEEAEIKVSNALKNKINNLQLKLIYKDKVWEYSSKDFIISTNIHTIIDDAFKYSKLNSNNNIYEITKQGYNFDIAFNFIFKDFKNKVEEIKNEINLDPINSEVEFLPNSTQIFKITKSQNGVMLDEEKLYAELERKFKDLSDIEIELQTCQISPKITEDYYKDKSSQL